MRKVEFPNKRLAYSVEEVAALLGVHIESVRREIRAGRLVAGRMGRKLLIPADSLEKYLKTPKPQPKKQEAQP